MKKGVGSGDGSGSIGQRYGSRDPDPHQNVMDPACKSITNIFFVKFAFKMLDILLSSPLATLENDFATTGILDCLLLYARREGQGEGSCYWISIFSSITTSGNFLSTI
jgi:hypothetical protein